MVFAGTWMMRELFSQTFSIGTIVDSVRGFTPIQNLTFNLQRILSLILSNLTYFKLVVGEFDVRIKLD